MYRKPKPGRSGDEVLQGSRTLKIILQYRKENLIAQFGPIALPDLRHEIARCERHQKTGDACAVHYIGLTAKAGGVPKPPSPPPPPPPPPSP